MLPAGLFLGAQGSQQPFAFLAQFRDGLHAQAGHPLQALERLLKCADLLPGAARPRLLQRCLGLGVLLPEHRQGGRKPLRLGQQRLGRDACFFGSHLFPFLRNLQEALGSVIC